MYIIGEKGKYFMKKTIFLLMSAMVLALTACNGKGKSSNQSGNQSSIEEPTIPTPAELSEAFKNGSYTLTIFEGEYDAPEEGEVVEPEDFEYSTSSQIQKEGPIENTKVVFLNGLYGENGYHYEPAAYGESRDSIIYSYEYNEPFWLRLPLNDNPYIEGAFTILIGTDAMFLDIEEGSEYTWTHDEENNTYHGEYVGGNTVTIDLQLCLGFFEKLVMRSIFNGKVTQSLIEVSNFNKTTVELPEAPISDIYDNMMEIFKVFEHTTSLTVNRRIEVNGEVMQTAVFKVVNGQDEEMTLQITLNNQPISSYYHRVKDGNSFVYTYKQGNGEWTSTNEEDFDNAIFGVNYPISFLNCPHPIALASITKEVLENTSSSFSVAVRTYADNDEPVTETISCSFDSDYYLQTFKSTIGDTNTYYSYSDYDKTVID